MKLTVFTCYYPISSLLPLTVTHHSMLRSCLLVLFYSTALSSGKNWDASQMPALQAMSPKFGVLFVSDLFPCLLTI